MILSGRRVFGPDIGKIDLPQLLKGEEMCFIFCYASTSFKSFYYFIASSFVK